MIRIPLLTVNTWGDASGRADTVPKKDASFPLSVTALSRREQKDGLLSFNDADRIKIEHALPPDKEPDCGFTQTMAWIPDALGRSPLCFQEWHDLLHDKGREKLVSIVVEMTARVSIHRLRMLLENLCRIKIVYT